MAQVSDFDPRVSLNEGERVRWQWEDARRYFKPRHESIGKEFEFSMEMAHWRFDAKDEIDPRRIRPKDETLYRRIRYLAGMILAPPLSFQGLPTDPKHTPEQVETAAGVVEWEFTNPVKRFETVLSKAVWGALSARVWFLAQDFVRDLGPRGEIVDRAVDPRRVFWTPGYDDPHDPLCEWLIEEDYLAIAEVSGKKGWKNNKDLAPDAGKPTEEGGVAYKYGDGRVNLNSFSSQSFVGRTDIPRCTILKCYYKRDLRKIIRQSDDAPMLPNEDRYMACPVCGYQSLPQAEQEDPLAGFVANGCPDCGSDLYRIDTTGPNQSTLAYPAGQRLVIVAPYQPGGPVVLYDDRWPNTRDGYSLRSFPYTPIYFGESPNGPFGLSETTLLKDRQIIINVLLRHGYEQLSNAKLLTIVPRIGLEDWQGQPFALTDEQGHVAFKTGDYNQGIEYSQAPGVVSGLNSFYEIIVGSAKSNEGTSELGMEPGQSKDIAVGTIQALVKTGNVPIDDKIRMLRRQLSMHAMIRLDMWRCVNATPTPVRTKQADGSAQVQMLSSFDVIPADIVLTGTPSFDGFTTDRMQAWQQLVQMPPTYRASFMEAFNLPPSVLRAIQRDEKNAPHKAPNVAPDKLLVAISDLLKAQFPVAANQIEAALEMSGLPPASDGGSEIVHGAPGNGPTNGPLSPGPVAPGGAQNGAPSNVPGGPNGLPAPVPPALMAGR